MSFSTHIKQSIIWRGFYFITLLLLNVFLSRFLKADGSGIIFYLSNFFSFLVLILSFNMDGSFTYFASSKTIPFNHLASLALLWTALIALLVYVLLPHYFLFFDSDVVATDNNVSKYGLYYVVGILLANYFTALFYSFGRFALPNIILGSSNLLFIALIVFAGKVNASAGAVTKDYFFLILLQGIALSIAFVVTNINSQLLRIPNANQLKQLFKYSSIGLTGNFLFFFVYRIDYWFVKLWCHQSGDLGNYIQASKLSQMLLLLPQILASVIFPQMASGLQQGQVVESISRLFRLFLQLYCLLTIAAILFGNSLFPLIFGASFSTMYKPMLILLPGMFCLSVSTLLSAYFSGKKQNKYNVFAAMFALAVMLCLSFLLKNEYSIYIAASISSVAYFSEGMYCFIKFAQQEKISMKQFFMFSTADWKWVKNLFLN